MAFRKPKDYDDVRVGDYRILPAGGYVCKIIKAEETQSKTGKDMIKFYFDICEGEYEGYFNKQFKDRKASADDPTEVKWPFAGTKWVLVFNEDGSTKRDFKSLCTALEEGGVTVWDQNDVFQIGALKDSKIGIIFRREEHEYQGASSWRTVPWGFRSVKAIEEGSFKVPEDKPLPPQFTPTDSFEALEEDLPF